MTIWQVQALKTVWRHYVWCLPHQCQHPSHEFNPWAWWYRSAIAIRLIAVRLLPIGKLVLVEWLFTYISWLSYPWYCKFDSSTTEKILVFFETLLPLVLISFSRVEGRDFKGKLLRIWTFDIGLDFLLRPIEHEYSDKSWSFFDFMVIVSPATVVSSFWKECSDCWSLYFLKE